MSRSRDGFNQEWETARKIAMGERVGGLDDFKDMQENACVHVEERELIAWCKVFPLIFPKEKEFNKFLKETAIPALKIVGRGKWYRDTLTDLALALSSKQKGKDAEDTGDVLGEETT